MYEMNAQLQLMLWNEGTKTAHTNPQHPKLAMMEAYKLDKVACYKFMAAEKGTSISYCSRTDEARASNAADVESGRESCTGYTCQIWSTRQKKSLFRLRYYMNTKYKSEM